MSLIEEKNLKVIIFSGKQNEWKFWEVKLLARARCKGFKEILLGTVAIPKDLEKVNLTKSVEKKQQDIHELNELDFEELVLVIKTTKGDGRVPSFQSICCCMSNDNKKGNTVDAWKWLTNKYVPSKP